MKHTDCNMTPLFIPLKREYFEAFRLGTKVEEFRPVGPRWNASSCVVGRPVVLSLGYGTRSRLHGVVVGYRESAEPTKTDAWLKCYGTRQGLAACIRVELRDKQSTQSDRTCEQGCAGCEDCIDDDGQDDDRRCQRCDGDGADPLSDFALPCPLCLGEGV